MNPSQAWLRFIVVIVLAHTLAYLVAGGVAYQLVTKPLWEDPNALLAAYLRTPNNLALWDFAMTWQIPAQLLRGLLLGVALLPLVETLHAWKLWQRWGFLAGLLFVFTHFAAAAPSPANLEGLVYVKPEFVEQGFWVMQVEMIFYSLLAAFFMARWLYPTPKA